MKIQIHYLRLLDLSGFPPFPCEGWGRVARCAKVGKVGPVQVGPVFYRPGLGIIFKLVFFFLVDSMISSSIFLKLALRSWFRSSFFSEHLFSYMIWIHTSESVIL